MEPMTSKDMVQLQRAAFHNAFSALSMFQDQAESATRMVLEMGMLPEEGKKLFTDWIYAFKRGRECFKKAMDDNFKAVEEISQKRPAGRA